MIQALFIVGCVLALSLAQELSTPVVSKPAALGTYKISDVTVSGLSSGTFMAVQVHVAFSSVVNGSAVFAGGPYYCAQNNIIDAENVCMATYMGKPDVPALVKYTATQVSLKTIDDSKNLKDDMIYLFSGSGDSVVDSEVMKSLQSYYENYIDVSNLVVDYNVNAEHCFPTVNYGEACSTLKSPYIGKCNFDGAYTALNNLYGSLDSGKEVTGNLIEFDQTPFISGTKSSVGSSGYVYVPTSCANGATCSLHISFHGCKQDLKSIGNQYAANTGFNAWAEANDIIVLYPYAMISSYNPSNPNGCWDWWGYTDKSYALKSGVQMSFVKKMIDHITGTKK